MYTKTLSKRKETTMSNFKMGLSENDVKKSWTSWNAFKKECGNSYIYVRRTSSVFDEHYYHTHITIEEGQITKAYKTKHNYDFSAFDKFEAKLKGETSVEKEDKEENHSVEKIPLTDKEMSLLKTLDEIYDFVKKLPKVSAQKNYISFRIDNRGLITCAGYAPKGCTDDCFRGYSISSITSLK